MSKTENEDKPKTQQEIAEHYLKEIELEDDDKKTLLESLLIISHIYKDEN